MTWKNPDQASAIKSSEDFIMNGLLLCPEEKMRLDFNNTFAALCIKDQSSEHTALVYILGLLAKNFEMITDKPARQFFDVLNTLIDLNSELDLSETQAVYNPEKLLSQIIDKIRSIQEANRLAKIPLADEEKSKRSEVDELKISETTAENERMLVGLINLTGKILQNVDAAASARIVEEKQLIKEIFQEFLFASFYQAQELGE